jgi:hypothetical protein
LPQEVAPNSDLIILFSNQFLTRELQAQLAQSKNTASLEGLTLQGEAGQSIVVAGTGVVNGTSIKVPIRVILRPSVQGNQVNVAIVQAQLGTLKLPGSFFSPVQATINQELNRALANQQYQITGVGTTVDGVLVDVKLKS